MTGNRPHPDIDALNPESVAAAPAHRAFRLGDAMSVTPPADAVRRFFTADGCRLFIDRAVNEDDAALSVLGDAVLLDDHAPLLDGLDRWLGETLDWRPEAAQPDNKVAVPSGAWTLSSETGNARRIGFVPREPLPLDSQLPAPWNVLVRLVPPTLEGHLVLCDVMLQPEDAERLGPDALMLLPGSFKDEWDAVLDVAGMRISASIEAEADRVVLKGAAPEMESDASKRTRVSAARPFRLPSASMRATGGLMLAGRLTEEVRVLVGDTSFVAHPTRIGAGWGVRLASAETSCATDSGDSTDTPD